MEPVTIISGIVAAGSLILSIFAYRKNAKKMDEDKRDNLNKEITDLKTRMSVTEERCKGRGCITSAMLTEIDTKLDKIEDSLNDK